MILQLNFHHYKIINTYVTRFGLDEIDEEVDTEFFTILKLERTKEMQESASITKYDRTYYNPFNMRDNRSNLVVNY